MMQQSISALTFGFFASILAVLQVASAKAAECYIDYDYVCTKGGVAVEAGKHLDNLGVDEGFVRCCKGTLPSEGYATGETKQEQQQREVKECAAMGGRYDPQKTPRCSKPPVKNIGKSKATGGSTSTDKTPAVLKAARDCKAKGWRYDAQGGKCIKPSEAKADCEARGHKYDIDTGRCVKSIGKSKPQGAPDKAAEQDTRSGGASDDDNDYKPKRKKKRNYKHDNDGD